MKIIHARQVTPKKYSSPGLKKKNHRREMLKTKIMQLENSPPHNVSNGPSQAVLHGLPLGSSS